MKVTARGWRRDCGPWTLVNTDLYAEEKREDGFQLGEVAVRRTSGEVEITPRGFETTPGDVEILWGTSGVTLNGDYLFRVILSKADVARLVVEAFPEFEPVLTLLAGAGAKKTSDQADLPSGVAA